VRAGKVLTEQAQFAQAIGGHEVGVVNDGHEHFSGAIDAEGFLNQEPFTVVVAALELDLKGFTEDAQGIVIGVQGPVDDGRDHAFRVVMQEGLLQNAFAGSGFAQDQAKATLLCVDPEDVEDFLLVSQQGERFGVEGVALETKVSADHRECGVEGSAGFSDRSGRAGDGRVRRVFGGGWESAGRIAGIRLGLLRGPAVGAGAGPFRRPIVGDGIQRAGFSHALALVIDDHTPGGGLAFEAYLDGAIGQVAWSLEANGLEGEGVVGADVALFLDEEQLVVGFIGRKKTHAVAVQGEAVQWAHAENGVDLRVVLFLDPMRELTVECFEGGKIQLKGEELVASRAKKSFDFSFGGAVPYGRVGEQAADAGADLDDFLGGVDGSVIDVLCPAALCGRGPANC